jgi:predicted transcriptional regulator of viral defense system
MDILLTKVKTVFDNGNGYAQARDLRNAGIDAYHIKKLIDNQVIHAVKRGLYKWHDLSPAENDLPETARLVPEGVFCLYSACHYYDLGDYVPFEHHIAVERHQKVTLPAYPPVHLYYWTQRHLDTGVLTINTPQGAFRITDLEKTVCDMVKYRNKVGKELLAKVLRDYVQHPKRNLNMILKYARVVRVEIILTTYLETLL